MTTCPSCGIAGDNLGCPNHSYWGINPLPDSIPMPEQSAWSSLYAEIGRLNVLLNERNKEIERLKGLMPPDERGPGFVGQGSWSVYAEKVVAERDALREVLTGLREKGIIDQHNRPLPLEGHHKDCGHGKDGWSLCTCEGLNEIEKPYVEKKICPKCNNTGRVTITDGIVATSGWCECSKEFKVLVEVGQQLRKEFDKKTAGMRGPPQCSKCGDTGLVAYGPNLRGMKHCDCKRTGVRQSDSLKELDELKEKDWEIERLRGEVDQLNREAHIFYNLRDNLFVERAELKECLRWYVENDDTNEGGKWEESNAHWLEGRKRRAMRALGLEE